MNTQESVKGSEFEKLPLKYEHGVKRGAVKTVNPAFNAVRSTVKGHEEDKRTSGDRHVLLAKHAEENPPSCYSTRENKMPNTISDDDILSLWRTVSPSHEQDSEMVFQKGELGGDCPTAELRRLVELSIEHGKEKAISRNIDDLFPFEYKGGGYFRRKGVPEGQSAEILHGEEAIKFLIRQIKNG